MEESDQRKTRRVRVAIRAGIIHPRSGERHPCILRDASIAGCKVVCESLEDLPDDIYMDVPSLEEMIGGRIVWRHERAAGVEFDWERTRNKGKRGAPRQEVEINAVIFERNHTHVTDCVIRDASKTGCCIATENVPLIPDDICIQIEGLSKAVKARVAWRKDDRAGLEFLWNSEVTTLEA